VHAQNPPTAGAKLIEQTLAATGLDGTQRLLLRRFDDGARFDLYAPAPRSATASAVERIDRTLGSAKGISHHIDHNIAIGLEAA
jgi:hypothetical protein